MASNKIVEPQEKDVSSEGSKVLQNSSDDAKVLAATALSAVRDSTSISGRGKVEVPILSFFFFYPLLLLETYRAEKGFH